MVQRKDGGFMSLVLQIGILFFFSLLITASNMFYQCQNPPIWQSLSGCSRPELIDRALLRPGRFEELLYIPLPSPQERGLILKALARKKPIDTDVDLLAIAERTACDHFSGADLAFLVCSLHSLFLIFAMSLSQFWYSYILQCMFIKMLIFLSISNIG